VAYFAPARPRHALPIQDLRVTTGWNYAEQPHRVGRVDVQVAFRGELEAAMRERLRRVAEACTVHQTLAHPPEIRVTLLEKARNGGTPRGEASIHEPIV
jgi:uncharacterized OsmC-like protein